MPPLVPASPNTSPMILSYEGQPFVDRCSGPVLSAQDVPELTYAYEGAPFNPMSATAQDFSATTKTAISSYFSFSASTQTQILQWDPPAVNSVLDVSNPFSPFAVLDGSTLFGSAPSGAYNLVGWDPAALLFGLCEVWGWSISLQLGGTGTFEIESVTNPSSIGSAVTVAGLTGTVTESGPFKKDGKRGYITSGILGARALNKQLLLVANQTSMSSVAGLLPTVYLQSPGAATWKTISQAAQAIARAAGVSVQWATVDEVLTDMFAETGMTVQSALQSLAARVNAVLCWNGATGYVVIDPTQGWGGADTNDLSVCGMFAPGGISSRNILDLSNDIALLPVAVGQNAIISFNSSPLAAAPPPKIEQFFSTSSRPNPTANLPVDLPGNYDRSRGVYIQILPNDGLTTASGFGTTDNTVWFTSGLPIATDPKSGIDKVSLVGPFASVFPADLSDKQFTLNLGYVADISGMTANAQDIINAEEQQLNYRLAAENNKSRFFKSTVGSVSAVFQGAIPLPGQRISITDADGYALSGIIESVNVTGFGGSGWITITVANYIKINKLSAVGLLDYFLATGQPTA